MCDPDYAFSRTHSDLPDPEFPEPVVEGRAEDFHTPAWPAEEPDTLDVLAYEMADCVPVRIAILDRHLRILALNAEWRRLDLRRDQPLQRDFVETCLSAASEADRTVIAMGLKELAEGRSDTLTATVKFTHGGSHRGFALRGRKSPLMPKLIVVALLDMADNGRVPIDDRAMTRVVLDAEAAERKRIARELHDDTAQQLVAMQLGLAGLKECGNTAEFDGIYHNIEEALRSVQQELRTLSYSLHPPEIEGAGLTEALGIFVQGFARRTRLAATFIDETRGLIADGLTDRALYRVAQEALTNVGKHAKARNARVCLRAQDQKLVLEVDDDGIGIAPELCSGRSDARLGVGLSAMRERVEALSGRLEVYRLPKGTRVTAILPHTLGMPGRQGSMMLLRTA
jgi:two-component system, NarL family, sensor kinase